MHGTLVGVDACVCVSAGGLLSSAPGGLNSRLISAYHVDIQVPRRQLRHGDMRGLLARDAHIRIVFLDGVNVALRGETKRGVGAGEVVAVCLKTVGVRQCPRGNVLRNTNRLAIVSFLNGILL